MCVGGLPSAALAADAVAEDAANTAADKAAAQRMAESPWWQQRKRVVLAAQAQRWDEAITQARQLYAMALPTGNAYSQMDAAELLVQLLHQRQQYPQAMAVVDDMLALWKTDDTGPAPGQMEALVQRGLLEAVMAQDSTAQDRYLQQLHQQSQLFPAQWQWQVAQRRVHYQTAQLTLPWVQGRWILSQLQPAHERDETVNVQYLYAPAQGSRMRLRLHLRYAPEWQGRDAAARMAALREGADYVGQDRVLEPGLQPPPLPFAQMTQYRYATREKAQGQRPDLLQLHWNAVRGPWHWHMELELAATERETALQQVPALLQAMDWPQAPVLAADVSQREQAVSTRWQRQGQWAQAGTLARAALPDALFPNERARLHTVAALAAYKAGRDAEAQQQMAQALPIWPYASLNHRSEVLQEHAQQLGAALATAQGRHADAAALMRQYLRNAGGLQNIWFQPSEPTVAQLHNLRTGMVLPMWAADFYLQEPVDDQRMLYRDLRTEQTLGLTLGLTVPQSEAAQEKLLRTALEKQFRLVPDVLVKQPFTPVVREGRPPAQGQHWVFTVKKAPVAPGTLDVSARPSAAAPQRVLLWIVDQGGQRALLRATVATQAEAQRAQALAQALRW